MLKGYPANITKNKFQIGTGRVMRVSLITGQLQAYVPATTETITNPYAETRTPEYFKTELNSQMLQQGIDAYCEEVLVVQNIFSNTYANAILVPEQASYETKTLLIYELLAIVGVLIAIAGVVWLLYNIFVYEPTHQQNAPPGSGETDLWTYQRKYSWLLDHYWYVCGKDLSASGPKAGVTWIDYTPSVLYASKEEVPQAEVELFYEHCNDVNTPDFRPLETDWIMPIVYGVVIIGAVYVAAKVLPSLLSKKETTVRKRR